MNSLNSVNVNAKKISTCIMAFVVFILCASLASAYVNPAAKLCIDKGHEYVIETDADGNQAGYCILDDGEKEAEWHYFRDHYVSKRNLDMLYSDQEKNLARSLENIFESSEVKEDIEDSEDVDTEISGKTGAALSSFDWRDNDGNWVTPIRDQGLCGTCWAFSSVATVESRARIDLEDYNYNIDLSEQEVVDYNTGNSSCAGGFESDAFGFMASTGVVREDCMPYNTSTRCSTWSNESLKISNYNSISASASAIKTAISTYGPITAQMVVCDDFMAFNNDSGVYYHTGDVYYDDSCWWTDGESDYLNWHSIAIVGYNDTGGYWIVKNSWGTTWGEEGYIRINYNQTVTDYRAWFDAVLNDPDGDSRVFFIDDSYYATGTDILTNPTVNSASSNVTSTGNSATPILFTVYAEPKSIKELENVTINSTAMNGSLTGGTFNVTKTPADFGCQNMEGRCNLTITATDDADRSASANLNVIVDDKAPRITLISPKTPQNTASITFTYNVSENPLNASINCSLYLNNVYNKSRTTTANVASQSFTAMTLADGLYNWSVGCTDAYSHSDRTAEQQFSVDSTAPTLAVNSTSATEVDEGSAVTIYTTWNYGTNNVSTGKLYVNGTLNLTNSTPVNAAGSANVSFTYTTTSAQAGKDINFYVKVNDTAGLNSANTPNMTVHVNDITPPVFNPALTNKVIEYGTAFSYDVNATDNVKVGTYSINDTTNLKINSTTGLITNNTVLNLGVYPVNVSVNDTSGNTNSSVITVTVQDTTAPAFNPTLVNQLVEYGSALSYDINATDAVGVNTYWINDTTNFAIDGTGLLTNATELALGTYRVNVSVNDTTGNTNSGAITVTVRDTVLPYFNPLPENQELNYTQAFSYDVNATDNVNISTYWVNDTTNFAINGNGLITNNTVLPVGNHSLKIYVNDTSGNQNSTIIYVNVKQTETTDITGNTSEELDFPESDMNITLNLLENVTTTIIIGESNPGTAPDGLNTLKIRDITIDSNTEGNLSWALIKIFYSDSELGTLKEDSLKIYYYNETSASWELEPVQGVDTVNNYVWANVTHFSLFGAFGEKKSSGGGGGGGTGTTTVQTINLTAGVPQNLSLKLGSSGIQFKRGTELHSIKISNSSADSVEFTISSDPIKVTLKAGETEQIDVNGNGQDDLELTLVSWSGSTAVVELTALTEILKAVTSEELGTTGAATTNVTNKTTQTTEDKTASQTPSQTTLPEEPKDKALFLIIVGAIILGVIGFVVMRVKKHKKR